VTASYMAPSHGAFKLLKVPAQLLVVQRRKLASQTTAHYVLLGPIPGAP
jgi:hypothetical protein